MSITQWLNSSFVPPSFGKTEVSAERSALELEAERLGYIKPHRALRPSGLPSGADPDVTVEGEGETKKERRIGWRNR